MRFKFSFILIGKFTMAFLTGQSWRVLKSWYSGGGTEQGFRCYFANGLYQNLVSSVAQATESPSLLSTWNLKKLSLSEGAPPPPPTRIRSLGSTGSGDCPLTREAPLVCAFSRLTDSNCCCVNDGTDLSVCKNKRQTCKTNVRCTPRKYR